KKIRLEHRMLVRVGLAFGVVVLALIGALAHYFQVVGKVAENELIRAENLELQNRWREAEQKFSHINDELDRVKRLNANLRHITSLNDPDRKLSMAQPDMGQMAPEFVGGGIATEPAQAGIGAVGTGRPPAAGGEGRMIADGDAGARSCRRDRGLRRPGRRLRARPRTRPWLWAEDALRPPPEHQREVGREGEAGTVRGGGREHWPQHRAARPLRGPGERRRGQPAQVHS